jgi:hypothetical protein
MKMKAITTLLISGFVALSGIASANTVTLIFKGITKNTNNYQVSLDGKNYYSNTNTQSGQVTIDNLPLGRHTLKVYKLRYNSTKYNGRTKNTLVYTKVFELRQGYDMSIIVQNNGKVLFSEDQGELSGSGNTSANGMSLSAFNTLVQTVANSRSQSTRANTIQNALANSDNYFTTNQVRQLIVMVTSENSRLALVKLAHNRVTDPASFNTLIDLFKSTAYRNEFNNYMALNGGQTVGSTGQQMSDYQFNSLLQNVRGQWAQSAKAETVHEAFANNNNYFTTAQVRELVTMVTSESDRLSLVKLVYRGVVDKPNFGTLADLFTSTYYRNQFYTYAGITAPPAQTGTNTQLSAYQFNNLIQTVKNQWSQSLKGQTIHDAFANSNNYFTTAQIRQLLELITSEPDRLQLVKLAYKQTTDQANFSSLADMFTSTTYRIEFNDYVYAQGGTNTTNTTVKSPMASADFDMLVLGVRANLLQFLKVSSETNIFNNQSYYFTTAQVRELISLINSESSRLDLAKLAYKTVTDRENYSQLNDLFESQANRDALTAYVQAYRD